MSITFDCSSCGKAIAADVDPGRQVICPFCNATVTAPGGVGERSGAVPPQMPGAILAPPQVKTGLAVTAMICGIIGMFICLPLGIVGLILGIFALVKAVRAPDQYGGKGMAIAGICTGAVALVMVPLLIAILLPSLARARELAKRSVCASSLANLGNALVSYANANKDLLPPDLDTLFQSQVFYGPPSLRCPSATEDHQHYIYIPARKLDDMDPKTPIVIEDPENHNGEGGNVLFGDSHVEWVQGPRLEQMLEDAGTGIPLPSP